MRALLPLLLILSLDARGASFRNNGTGVYEASPPAAFGPLAGARWSVTLPSWSNSSPVLFAGQVCTLAEPTTVWCVDAESGKVRWSATNGYVETLAAKDRPAFEARVAAAEQAAGEVVRLQSRFGALRKALRSAPGDAAMSAELAQVSAALASAQALVDGFAPFRTPPDRELIGYTTHTPVADNSRLYVLVGNGVTSAFDPTGKRLWSRWLGPAPRPPRGYALGTAASPLLVDGLLIVAHGALVALDPATGVERWRSVAYKDFGTPAVARVGSTSVLLTPAGEVVRAADGAVLATGLGDVWYTGPLVVGQDVYYLGGKSDVHISQGSTRVAASWHLAETSPGVVSATRRWSTSLPSTEPFYTPGVSTPDGIVVVDRGTNVWRLDPGTGAVSRSPAPVQDIVFGPGYSSPVLAGGRLWLWSESGTGASWLPGAPSADTWRWEPMRSTPVFERDRLYVRTLDHLICLGGGP